MRTLFRTLSFTAAFIFVMNGSVAAQQQIASISDLKEQIKKLEVIELDSSTPPEVRNLNHGFLEERRVQLRAALQKRIGALRAYQESVGGALSQDENKVVQNSIHALEADLQSLDSEMRNSESAEVVAAPPASPARPEASQVSSDSLPAPAANIVKAAPAGTKLAQPFSKNLFDDPAPPPAPVANTYKDAPPLLSDIVD